MRQRTARWLGGGLALAAGGYAAYVVSTWLRYGHARRPGPAELNTLLDQFLTDYEVAERHQVHVSAPPEITLSAAAAVDCSSPPSFERSSTLVG